MQVTDVSVIVVEDKNNSELQKKIIVKENKHLLFTFNSLLHLEM